MKLKNTFTAGRMNKDADERLLNSEEYIHAENVNVTDSLDSDQGVVKNVQSNIQMGNTLNFQGDDPQCIGAVADDVNRKVYWFVVTDTTNYLCEYDQDLNTSNFLLEDSREGPANVLNFKRWYHIHSANILHDSDRDRVFLFWTDGYNPPRRINVNRAIDYKRNEFKEEDIAVIQKPPFNQPEVEFVSDDSSEENFLSDKFLQFAYRYKYIDGEFSALSPFSEHAFFPKQFYYDYQEGVNKSMENNYNQVNISFETGGKNVTDIQLVYKNSKTSTVYVAESFNKKRLKIEDNQTHFFSFKNNKVYTVLPSDEILRLYDAVPRKAETQDLIGNRLIYGNYTENYNLVDFDQKEINFNFTVSKESTKLQRNHPYKTVKSNRLYEIGIVYIDDYGRMSTVITSPTNTLQVPTTDADKQVTIYASITHEAPYWAKYYRLFIKEAQQKYDTITPIIFHKDGDFRWIKVEKSDVDKFKAGDFIIVKSDTSGIKTSYVETKVLEFEQKERNFLDTDDTAQPGEILQEEGLYIKLKPSDYNIDDTGYYKKYSEAYDSSGNKTRGRFRNASSVEYFEGPSFYGGDATATSQVTVSGTPTSDVDQRFEVEVDNTSGASDTFKWRVRSEDGDGNWTYGVTITGSAQTLQDGLSITFAQTTGNYVGDKYYIYARVPFSINENARTNVALEGFADDEPIGPGSFFRFYYSEYRNPLLGKSESNVISETYTANKQFNTIEDWWWEEAREEITKFKAESKFKFRRGTFGNDKKTRVDFSSDTNDPLFLYIDSTLSQSWDLAAQVHVDATWNIIAKQNDALLIFETKPETENSDIFYEIGETYTINNQGHHQGKGTDQSQNSSQGAIIKLDWSNCFGWGNGIESYKYKDTFNADEMLHNARALTNYDGYSENHRKSSLTYSGVYQQQTNFNALNEFNLSQTNFRDVDDKYGAINKITSRDTDLIVFQENKVSKILFGKSVLYNADGSGNVSQTEDVLGTQVPFAGEYGIPFSPESLSQWSNDIYFADERRTAICRLSAQSGIVEVSSYGMTDWFKDNIDPAKLYFIKGGYDPVSKQYVVSLQNPVVDWLEDAHTCEGVDEEWRVDAYYCKQVVPQPVPVPQPAPVPQPVAPQPIPQPQPAPQPQPQPAPQPQPTPQPQPAPQPVAPQPQPVAPQPQPVAPQPVPAAPQPAPVAPSPAPQSQCTAFSASNGFTTTSDTDCFQTLSSTLYLDMAGKLAPEAGMTVYNTSGCTGAINSPNTYFVINNTTFGKWRILMNSNGSTINSVFDCSTAPSPAAPSPAPAAPLCYNYDLSSDGGETVTFTYQRCNNGATQTATVPNGDSITVCARENSVTMSPNSGTISQGTGCFG